MSTSKQSFTVSFLSALFIVVFVACKHSSPSLQNEARPTILMNSNINGKYLFDLNDVSILMRAYTANSDKSHYLHLDAQTKDGPLVTEAMIKDSFKMLPNPNPVPFKDWGLAAVRFDNCARLLAHLPCEAEIRLVFQPFGPEGFLDQAIHLAYTVHESDKIKMFQELLELKISALPESTVGPLGEHPILIKQGMNGDYAKKLHMLILKFIHPVQIQRIAVMTANGALSSEWHFAATQPIKNQKIEQSPIPCLSGEKVSSFVIETQGPFSPGIPNVLPSNTTCLDFNVNPLITRKFTSEEKMKALENAARTNNPEISFFASTTCVSCHLASRRQEQFESGLSTKETYPFSFKAPSDVSNQVSKEAADDNKSPYGIRAFGWGEHGTAPGITTYTLNDTIRVAHELNELVREGKLQAD